MAVLNCLCVFRNNLFLITFVLLKKYKNDDNDDDDSDSSNSDSSNSSSRDSGSDDGSASDERGFASYGDIDVSERDRKKSRGDKNLFLFSV